MRNRLPPDRIEGKLKELNGSSAHAWSIEEGMLLREFVFADFKAAFAFMTKVACLAEEMDHHPNWENVYDRVTIRLYTHDLGGLSSLDFELAGRIQEVL